MTPCGADSRASASAAGLHVAVIAPRDVVAAEHDEIGPLRHQHVDGGRHQLVRHRLAAMEVGQHAEAQPAQRLRQPGDRKGRPRQLEMMAFVQRIRARRRRWPCRARRRPAP